jgi:hypothetical protein
LKVKRETTAELQNSLIKFDIKELNNYITTDTEIQTATLWLKTTGATPDGIDTNIYRVTAGSWNAGSGDGRYALKNEADWIHRLHGDTDITGKRWYVPGCLQRGDLDHTSNGFGIKTPTKSNKWISWNVILAVKYFFNNPDENFGFILRYPRIGGSSVFGEVEFYSSEAVDNTTRPYLEVTFT